MSDGTIILYQHHSVHCSDLLFLFFDLIVYDFHNAKKRLSGFDIAIDSRYFASIFICYTRF